jgi:ferredoxin
MRIAVDRTVCTGVGHCEVTAPAVFELDELGEPVVLVEHIDAGQLDAVRAAVNGCPTRALSLLEESPGSKGNPCH